MRENKQNKEKNKILKFWKDLWKLLKPSQKQMKILIVLILFVELIQMLGPYILKLIIDTLTASGVNELKNLLILILFFFLAEGSTQIIIYFINRRIFVMLIKIENYLPTKAQKKLVYLSLSYHERENTGNKIVKIERGVNRIVDLIGNLAWDVVPTLFQLILTLTILFIINWLIGLSFVFFAFLFIILTFKANKKLFPLRKARHIDYEAAYGQMTQSIININTVKSFTQEKREVKELKDIQDKISKNETREWFTMLKFGVSRGFINDLGRVSVLLLGVYFVYIGNITIGTLVFVITLSEKAYISLWRISRLYDRIEESAVAVQRFMRLFNEKEEIENPENGIIPAKPDGAIEFKNVDYAYKTNKSKALDKVNFKINAGCVTALVGPSGGGKTTAVRMIYRHYDPQGGSVLLDGINLKKYDLYKYRKLIAIVPQEVEIFNTSIKNNISYSNPKASFQEIQAAARIANAEEFINKLNKKYNTEVGERGIKLSGGQRQRIGIARAILANPKILIFDEATSNLDSQSEKLIQEAMDKVCRGRTVILIAHRLSTIKKADKIIVLENGKVVESGSHYELARKKGGLYAKLLNLQEVGEIKK